jgi:hypothetical protein
MAMHEVYIGRQDLFLHLWSDGSDRQHCLWVYMKCPNVIPIMFKRGANGPPDRTVPAVDGQ